jgi:hypothetical protein
MQVGIFISTYRFLFFFSRVDSGGCGCPNDCYADEGFGTCVNANGVNSCSCARGWTGLDCSWPSCPENACSGHGKCLSAKDSSNSLGIDYCECEEGFTSTTCQTTVNPLLGDKNPWGEIFDHKAYGGVDKYEDNHPVFDSSVLATIRITMSHDDYMLCIDPYNLYNETWMKGDMIFYNGNITPPVTLNSVGVKIKGKYTRMDQKKAWQISFDQFADTKQNLYGLKKIGLKNGFVIDYPDSLAMNALAVDMFRAMGFPTYRVSYALLYINDMYSGVYLMHEDFDKDFFKSRFDGDDGSGDYYKLNHVHLNYKFGDDISAYQQDHYEIPYPYGPQADVYKYELDLGQGVWQDFIDVLYYVNTTTGQQFEDTVNDIINTDNTIHNMIAESFMMPDDNIQHGANFGFYHRTKASKSSQWSYVVYDFDDWMWFNATSDKPMACPDILEYWLEDPLKDKGQVGSWFDYNLLQRRMLLESPKYYQMFLDHYNTFLTALFGASSKQQPADRLLQYAEFIFPWYKRDKLLTLAYDPEGTLFLQGMRKSYDRLQARFVDVRDQLQALAQKKTK